MKSLNKLKITNFKTVADELIPEIELSYEFFGEKNINETILLIHPLTSNSNAFGSNGWWTSLFQNSSLYSLKEFSFLAINFPGNNYGSDYNENYFKLTSHDLSELVKILTDYCGIKQYKAVIGTSVGGMLTWQLAFNFPNLSRIWVPVYAHYKTTDWIIAFNYLQNQFINDSKSNLNFSRMLALLSYRSAESFEQKFYSRKTDCGEKFEVESYLEYQGAKLQDRYSASSYKLMLHYMNSFHPISKTETELQQFNKINGFVAQVFTDSDVLFLEYLVKRNHKNLKYLNKDAELYKISSIHGHDSFLIEQDQIKKILIEILTKD